MSVATYTKTGTKATTPAKLNKSVFGVEVTNHQLLKDAYLAYLANGRINHAVTKRRGEVRGGGRKPHRQKGTGRARAGSSRSPLWRGGGIIFGPTGEENYSRTLSTAAKRQALRQGLSLASKAGKLLVIEDFVVGDGKTKTAAGFFAKIGAKGKTLLVLQTKDSAMQLAIGNLPGVILVQAKYLNIFDILNADQIVISRKALDIVHEWLGSSAKTLQGKEAKND